MNVGNGIQFILIFELIDNVLDALTIVATSFLLSSLTELKDGNKKIKRIAC